MFGKMISRGARSNLKKSMVKLHKAKFGSPVHRQSVQDVALNLELICKHWDHHPSSPLLPSQEVIVDFAEYICRTVVTLKKKENAFLFHKLI